MVHIYMGDGKGKTSAAVGLGIRAAGYKRSIVMLQFLKTAKTGENIFLENVPNFTVKRFETSHGFLWDMSDTGKAKLKNEINTAFLYLQDIINSSACDILILDEVLDAIECELLDGGKLLSVLKSASQHMEIILTGRHADSEFLNLADYISDIQCVKHPYQNGTTAREGIEY